MTDFLRADVEQQIVPQQIVRLTPGWNDVLHDGGPFAIRFGNLLGQQVAEAKFWRAGFDRVHQLPNMAKHCLSMARAFSTNSPSGFE